MDGAAAAGAVPPSPHPLRIGGALPGFTRLGSALPGSVWLYPARFGSFCLDSALPGSRFPHPAPDPPPRRGAGSWKLRTAAGLRALPVPKAAGPSPAAPTLSSRTPPGGSPRPCPSPRGRAVRGAKGGRREKEVLSTPLSSPGCRYRAVGA